MCNLGVLWHLSTEAVAKGIAPEVSLAFHEVN
jgi:hypothetical protein